MASTGHRRQGVWRQGDIDASPEALEHAAARHWRGTSESYLGSWLLRAADGFTGRANSALALGSPGFPLDDALAEVVAWYRSRNLPAMIQLPTDHPLDPSLAERRWAIRPGPALVMTASPAVVAAPHPDVEFAPAPDAAWLARYNYRGSSLPPVAEAVLMSAPEQYFASIRIPSGAAIAIARLSLSSDGRAGLTAVEVDPAYRRRGLGAAITRAACAEATQRGATPIFLQTEATNAPARALYDRLGFHPSHTYHYRRAP
jgi:ribosomal protein S18 acetylase RimI-like enzyme